jgi:hypothetical protein
VTRVCGIAERYTHCVCGTHRMCVFVYEFVLCVCGKRGIYGYIELDRSGIIPCRNTRRGRGEGGGTTEPHRPSPRLQHPHSCAPAVETQVAHIRHTHSTHLAQNSHSCHTNSPEHSHAHKFNITNLSTCVCLCVSLCVCVCVFVFICVSLCVCV